MYHFIGANILDFNDLLKFEFTNGENEGVFIIDEAGICLNNRDWDKLEKDVIKFFKLHRHFKISVYIFSQGEDIDITFRRLAHKWYKIIKLPLLLNKYSALIPVSTLLAIENGKWCLQYKAETFPLFWRYIPIWKTWRYFNSFSVPYLPKKEFETWDILESETKFQKFKKKIAQIKGIIKIKLLKLFFTHKRNKVTKECEDNNNFD